VKSLLEQGNVDVSIKRNKRVKKMKIPLIKIGLALTIIGSIGTLFLYNSGEVISFICGLFVGSGVGMLGIGLYRKKTKMV